MKPLLYVVCSGFDLTCEGEKRLSKNRRAVNCGAKERGGASRGRGREGRKGLLVTRSEGERLKGQIYMCGENRSAWHACLPFSKTCVAKRERGEYQGNTEKFLDVKFLHVVSIA